MNVHIIFPPFSHAVMLSFLHLQYMCVYVKAAFSKSGTYLTFFQLPTRSRSTRIFFSHQFPVKKYCFGYDLPLQRERKHESRLLDEFVARIFFRFFHVAASTLENNPLHVVPFVFLVCDTPVQKNIITFLGVNKGKFFLGIFRPRNLRATCSCARRSQWNMLLHNVPVLWMNFVQSTSKLRRLSWGVSKLFGEATVASDWKNPRTHRQFMNENAGKCTHKHHCQCSFCSQIVKT